MTYTVLRNREIIIEREADSALGEPLAERRGDKRVLLLTWMEKVKRFI